jgi:hypothetical protein
VPTLRGSSQVYGVEPIVVSNDDPGCHRLDFRDFDGAVVSPGLTAARANSPLRSGGIAAIRAVGSGKRYHSVRKCHRKSYAFLVGLTWSMLTVVAGFSKLRQSVMALTQGSGGAKHVVHSR